MKKSDVFRLTFSDFSDRLIPVSERNTMKNTMTMTEIRRHLNLRNRREAAKQTANKVLVSCCGCNEELHISQEEADQWTDTDWFQCHECE